MEINYDILKDEVIAALGKNPVWVLSTSLNGYVTSRSMSIVNAGLTVYFQTNTCYIKHEQMNSNQQVSLCCKNISIEGIAENLGDWNDNIQYLELYKSKHLGSYKRYGTLEGQVVYKVTPTTIKLWKYADGELVDGEPLREVLFVNEQRAERLEFM